LIPEEGFLDFGYPHHLHNIYTNMLRLFWSTTYISGRALLVEHGHVRDLILKFMANVYFEGLCRSLEMWHR